MAYATVTDLKKLIPELIIIQLTDDENTGSINQTRVDEAIAQADAEIDSYCGSLFTVPFTPVPDIIKKMSVDITIYNLYSRRVEKIPETRADRYKNAIGQLNSIAKGLISIGQQPEPPSTTDSGIKANKTADDRIFTRDKMKGF